MTTRKVDTQNDDVVNSDILVNKYQNRSKVKSSILPQSISKMVTKHREKMQEQLEIETENCAESYNSNDDLAKNYDESAENVDTQEEEEVEGSHSWDVSVKSLIIEDMKNKMKMEKAKAKLKSKPPKGPDKAKQKPELLHDTDHTNKSELKSSSGNETATTKLKTRTCVAEPSMGSVTTTLGNSKNNQNNNKLSEFNSDNIGTTKRLAKLDDEENVYDFESKEDETDLIKPKRGKRTVKAKRKASETADNDMDVDVADADVVDAASDGDDDDDDATSGQKKRKATKATKSTPAAKRRKANTGDVVVGIYLTCLIS